MLVDGVVSIVERSVRTSALDLGAKIQAIGIVADHVHVAVSIPPNAAISFVVGRFKGASAHAVNDVLGRSGGPAFAWQADYGVFSFGEKNLPTLVANVENQIEHHAMGTTWPSLERIEDA